MLGKLNGSSGSRRDRRDVPVAEDSSSAFGPLPGRGTAVSAHIQPMTELRYIETEAQWEALPVGTLARVGYISKAADAVAVSSKTMRSPIPDGVGGHRRTRPEGGAEVR
jgi:hypothetical protein